MRFGGEVHLMVREHAVAKLAASPWYSVQGLVFEKREIIFNEFTTSDRKLKASREGSK